MKGAEKFKKGWFKALIRLGLVILLVGSLFLFLEQRKEALLKKCTRILESSLSQSTDYKIQIGKVSGHLTGLIVFKDIKVEKPWLLSGEESVFKADEIRFRYNWRDFFSKNFSSKIEITVTKPVVYWKPRASVKKPDFPFLTWMRDWVAAQKDHFEVNINSMTLVFGYQNREIKGIDIFYKDNTFRAEAPLSHIRLGASDLSSVIKFEGHFEPGAVIEKDLLRGKITTEGSVINWKPLPYESQFDFEFSREGFQMNSSNFLGGGEATANVDFTNDYAVDIQAKAQNYPLMNLDPFFGFGGNVGSQARLDAAVHFHGSPWAPSVEARCRIYEGWISKKAFKAMDINVQGVYPTVRLTDSHILLEDGSSMRIADKTLEVNELFRGKTYETLVSEAQQDTVVWGDWELSRQKGDNDRPEFMMQRNLGSKADVYVTKFTANEKPIESRESKDMEVGFEYHLRAKDSLKVELRNDEEFVGVERKMKF